jgi:rubrerythrin
MTTEQNNIIKAMELAIRMEINGKAFYQRVSTQSNHQLGQQLFLTLASEEDMHRQKFEEIYEAIRSKKSWPVIELPRDKGSTIKTIFEQASRSTVKSNTSDLEAIIIGIEMEDRSIDLYSDFYREATYPVEKSFYEALIGEEKGHRLALLDYQEYLKDPAGWFVEKEHPSLDG